MDRATVLDAKAYELGRRLADTVRHPAMRYWSRKLRIRAAELIRHRRRFSRYWARGSVKDFEYGYRVRAAILREQGFDVPTAYGK